MKEQNVFGIYVYYVLDKKVYFEYFESYETLFKRFVYRDFTAIFTDWEGIWKNCSTRRGLACWGDPAFFYAAYNERGRWLAPDHFIGKHREYVARINAEFDEKWRHKRLRGRRRKPYGKCKLPHTLPRYVSQLPDPDVQELEVNVKIRRKVDRPDRWDGYYYVQVEKSWKAQSKRKRQYKE